MKKGGLYSSCLNIFRIVSQLNWSGSQQVVIIILIIMIQRIIIIKLFK